MPVPPSPMDPRVEREDDRRGTALVPLAVYCDSQPPSIARVCPVTIDDASLAR